MEPEAAAWVPWDSQLTQWSMEPAVWTPGLPAEYQYAATEIFGSFLQTSNPTNFSSGGQMIQYAAGTRVRGSGTGVQGRLWT